ncbi:esterase/lipase family protein [Pelagibaculum spongiae]|uniref:Alpha/beta hydrolase n=1 Tax=Pelagibaculum spongiae TaxID=2080658 RepID=A0A2V1GUC8_9GAMM|nr:hypothetical protein [Pelagibaculum spongiae]PVZ68920.1 hypothetical protein DC094_11760 [Pelagibaculum spongiae]
MHQHYGIPCSCKRKSVVGLVFVPGIMGSRLFNTEKETVVWDPAVGTGSNPTGWLMAQREQQNRYMQLKLRNAIGKSSGVQSADSAGNIAKRASHHLKLQPQLQYEDNEEIRKLEGGKQNWRKVRAIWHLGSLLLSGPDDRKQMLVNAEPGATDRNNALLQVDRGTESYFTTFTSIQPRDIERRRQQGWGEVLWGSYGRFLSWLNSWVSSELGSQFHNWNFETYAVGYNWMLSNQKSGERLKSRIEAIKKELVEEYSVEQDNVKIIVVSHSMGGYASRAAAILEGADFDAVIHGAMPTHGSPATYINTRCGYGFPSGLALGINAAEVTAVVGYCQGALELLPNQYYKDKNGNHDWFKIQIEEQDAISISQQYPGEKIFDFYKDTSTWYSLIQPKLLMPASGFVFNKETSDDYEQRIFKVYQFHSRLSNKFHFNTKLLYGNNEEFPSYDQCIWYAAQAPEGLPHNWQIFEQQNDRYSLGEGNLQLTDRQSMTDYVVRYRQAWRQSRFSDGHENVLLNRVLPPPTSQYSFSTTTCQCPGRRHGTCRCR